MKDKEIIIFHPSSELYGADKILLEIIEALDPGRNVLKVMVPGEGMLTDILRERFPAVGLIVEPDLPVIARKYLTPGGIFRFFRQLGRFRKSFAKVCGEGAAVYLNTLAVLPVLAFSGKRRKSVVHVHEILDNGSLLGRMINRYALKKATRIICVSSAVADKFMELGGEGISRLTVVRNGIDIGGGEIVAEHVPGESGMVRFALLGRLKPEVKGQLLLIDAVSLIERRCLRNARFELIGSAVEGQEYMVDTIESAIAGKGLEEFISIRPFERDIESIYKSIDVALVPSVRADPLPTTVIEAMAFGLPVIGTDLGGIPEMIEDGETGYLVSPVNPEELAEKIKLLLESEDLRREMGRKGQERYREHFTKKKFTERYRSEIDRIL